MVHFGKNGAAKCNVEEEYGIGHACKNGRTELLFGVVTGWAQAIVGERSHYRHLANTVERL